MVQEGGEKLLPTTKKSSLALSFKLNFLNPWKDNSLEQESAKMAGGSEPVAGLGIRFYWNPARLIYIQAVSAARVLQQQSQVLVIGTV